MNSLFLNKNIEKYFSIYDTKIISKINSCFEIYSNWNEKINLISRKDFKNFYIHHFLHSLFLMKKIDFFENSFVLDVGSGGGFPSIPLAILNPKLNFVLIDSIKKKIMAVEDIASLLNLNNIKTIVDRVENLKEKYHYILGRAVINVNDFVKLTQKNLKKENQSNFGIYYLSGYSIIEENIKKIFKIKYDLCSDIFDEDYFKNKGLWSFTY